MGEKDIGNAARTNVRIGELVPRKMEAGSMLTSRDSSTTDAKQLPPRKPPEMEAQLLRRRIWRIRLQYRNYQIGVGSNITVGKYDESSRVSAMDYMVQSMERAEVIEFEAGHMINLEWPIELNNRLGIYLDEPLRRTTIAVDSRLSYFVFRGGQNNPSIFLIHYSLMTHEAPFGWLSTA